MASILTAILNLAQKSNNQIQEVKTSNNSANAMGDSLQSYIQHLFISDYVDLEDLNRKTSEIFSWTGTQNNIPDLMLRNGDAIEIKKVEGTSALALNSSFPKQVLSSSSTMITSGCKNCYGKGISWQKDLWYVVGTVKKKSIRYLFFVLGKLYAAEESNYERIRSKVKEGVNEIPEIVFSETKELGRVNKIDPLGITSLRIRGMWSIEHPISVFNYFREIEANETNNQLHCYVILTKEKFDSFSREEINALDKYSNISVFDKNIKDPNNPANLIESKLIKVVVGV